MRHEVEVDGGVRGAVRPVQGRHVLERWDDVCWQGRGRVK